MPYHSTTTLNEIREQGPCEDGWGKLLKHLGKTKADDEPLALLTILDSNGLDDAFWCLCVPSLERLSRHVRAWCAEQVLHLFEAERPDDTRIRDQIAMLRNDEASDSERAKAQQAALSAAAAAVAWSAARAAARAATMESETWSAWSARQAAAKAAAKAAAASWSAQETQLRKMLAE